MPSGTTRGKGAKEVRAGEEGDASQWPYGRARSEAELWDRCGAETGLLLGSSAEQGAEREKPNRKPEGGPQKREKKQKFR